MRASFLSRFLSAQMSRTIYRRLFTRYSWLFRLARLGAREPIDRVFQFFEQHIEFGAALTDNGLRAQFADASDGGHSGLGDVCLHSSKQLTLRSAPTCATGLRSYLAQSHHSETRASSPFLCNFLRKALHQNFKD